MTTLDVEHVSVPDMDAVVQQAVEAIHGDVMLSRIAALPAADLSAWCAEVIHGLHMWEAGKELETVTRVYYELGRAGAAWGIPVRELVRAVILTLNLGHSHAPADPTICDYARYYLIRGYEDAIR